MDITNPDRKFSTNKTQSAPNDPIIWAAVFTFNPYLLISINTDTTSIFIDINNSFIDINNSFIDINKDGCCIHLY